MPIPTIACHPWSLLGIRINCPFKKELKMFIGLPKTALQETLSQQCVFVGKSKGQVRRIVTQAGYDMRNFVIAEILEE
jgi:hypothetical protein